MSFTFEMDIGKGVLAIDIYNFIRAKQNNICGAVLIYIVGQPHSIIISLVVSMHLIGKILDRYKYLKLHIHEKCKNYPHAKISTCTVYIGISSTNVPFEKISFSIADT